MPAAPLVVFRRFLIMLPGHCRGAATLSQREKNKSADVQRKRVYFTRLLR
jgi:hypothetical protein